MFVKFKYRIKMHYNNNNRGRNCNRILDPHNIRKLVKITIYICYVSIVISNITSKRIKKVYTQQYKNIIKIVINSFKGRSREKHKI